MALTALDPAVNKIGSEYRALSAANGVTYPKDIVSHGHHIVFKKEGEEASKEAKDILIHYGIDPYFDRENLAFAPNRGGHTDAAMDGMRNRLKAEFGKTTTTKATIAALLMEFATQFVRRELPGMEGTQP